MVVGHEVPESNTIKFDGISLWKVVRISGLCSTEVRRMGYFYGWERTFLGTINVVEKVVDKKVEKFGRECKKMEKVFLSLYPSVKV